MACLSSGLSGDDGGGGIFNVNVTCGGSGDDIGTGDVDDGVMVLVVKSINGDSERVMRTFLAWNSKKNTISSLFFVFLLNF